jgi:hypothetical protein
MGWAKIDPSVRRARFDSDRAELVICWFPRFPVTIFFAAAL